LPSLLNRLASDEEEADENEDEVMVGCLGFVAGTTEANIVTSPVKSGKSNRTNSSSSSSSLSANPTTQNNQKKKQQRQQISSKTDITKVTPGKFI